MGLSKLLQQDGSIDEFFLDPKQKDRWFKTRSLLQQALVRSPLDWRISYGIYLLGHDLPDVELANLAVRLQYLSMHRPSYQLQLAVVEHSSGRTDQALALLSSTIQGTSGLDVSIAKLLIEWYGDEEIPTDIFVDDPVRLLLVAAVINREGFPIAHQKLIDRARILVEQLPKLDVQRSLLLATIARDEGDLAEALQHYREASRRKPSDTNIRFSIVDTAIRLGEADEADDELQKLRYAVANEQQVNAYQQMIEQLRRSQDPRQK